MILKQCEGTPSHAAVSKIQCEAVVEAYQSSAVSSAELADMTALVVGFKWAPSDLDRVLSVMMPSAKLAPGKRRRVSLVMCFALDLCSGSSHAWLANLLAMLCLADDAWHMDFKY